MGLEMRLYKRDKNSNSIFPEEVAFWGKYGFIFDWFDREVLHKDRSKEYYVVSKEIIEKLRDTCKIILEDHSRAKELLPLCDIEIEAKPNMVYTKLYFSTIQNTLDMLSEVLDSLVDFENEDVLFEFN